MIRDLKDVTRAVKEQADIVAVVSRTLPLKKAGNTYKGLCPFHNEKTPSFNVVPSKGIFHCFGCQAGGSVIDFVMRVEHLEFLDALKQLAHELQIPWPEREESPQAREARSKEEQRREALLAAHDFAAKWYRENLLRRRNPVAADYLKGRGVSDAISEQFRLGASLDDWDALTRELLRRGFSEDLLLTGGLSTKSRKATLIDRFRNRLIFPICDQRGRCIAFGGRRLDDADKESPKYLNSNETPLYHKGETIYALDVAHKEITRTGYALLTEGYMDTLMAHQHGFPQAVATLGTALTPKQATLLRRFAGKVFFLYDGDAAGQKAMVGGGEALLGAGFDARVITLPEGEDPDSFLRRDGADALRERLRDAPEYFDYALDALAQRHDTTSLAGQSALVEAATPLVRAFQNEVQREGAISRLQGRLGSMPRESVLRALGLSRAPASGQLRQGAPARVTPPAYKVPSVDHARYDPLERFALKLALENHEALELFRRDLDPVWLTDRNLDKWILHFLLRDGTAAEILAVLEAEDELPEGRGIVTEILADLQPIPDPEHAAQQLLVRLKRRHHQRNVVELAKKLDIKAASDQEHKQALRLLTTFHDEQTLKHRAEVPEAKHPIS